MRWFVLVGAVAAFLLPGPSVPDAAPFQAVRVQVPASDYFNYPLPTWEPHCLGFGSEWRLWDGTVLRACTSGGGGWGDRRVHRRSDVPWRGPHPPRDEPGDRAHAVLARVAQARVQGGDGGETGPGVCRCRGHGHADTPAFRRVHGRFRVARLERGPDTYRVLRLPRLPLPLR